MKLASVRAAQAAPGHRLSAATSFWARVVVDPEGQVLGSISDLMLDLERGRIAYAVVAAGGFMGMGERLFAVPWSALRAAGQRFVLECKVGALDTAPPFDRDHWTVTYRWHERVHAHYHSRPYWE